MKKAFLILSIIISILVLTACGGGNSAAPAAPAAPASNGSTTEAPKDSAPTADNATSAKVVDSLKLTMVGGSPGGFWSLVGEGTGNVLRQAIPNSQYSYETGNGVKNVLTVGAGEVSLGLVQNFEIMAGLNGEEPFKEKVSEVITLATIYNNASHQLVMSKEFSDKYGITSMEDIAEKKPPIRVAVNQRGNLLEKVNRIIFEAYGFTYDDIEKWGGEVFYEPYKAGVDMMKDNKVDWIGASTFAPDSAYLEVSTTKEIMLLSINEQAQKLLLERMGMQAGVITAGTYDFQPNDIHTVNVSSMIMADPKMSNDEAYTITKALVENLDSIKAIHNNLQVLTPEIMADVAPAKLHPGAEIYYKEKGIIK